MFTATLSGVAVCVRTFSRISSNNVAGRPGSSVGNLESFCRWDVSSNLDAVYMYGHTYSKSMDQPDRLPILLVVS